MERLLDLLCRLVSWLLSRKGTQGESRGYVELWNALVEFRKAAGALVSPFDPTPLSEAETAFCETFNAYQAVVRRHEPFVHPSVYKPARKVVTLGREMWGAHEQFQRLQERRREHLARDMDQKLADEQIAIKDRPRVMFDEIEGLAQKISKSIWRRSTRGTS